MTLRKREDKLSPTEELEERVMPRIECAKCGQSAQLSLNRVAHGRTSRDLEFRGVVTCSCEDRHEWPVAIKTDDIIQSTDQMMPVCESQNLSPEVPEALIQDVKDAERAHFAQIYRASVVMCRRALQLGFHEPPHSIIDGPYSKMLVALMALSSPPLTSETHGLAIGIGKYGGTGAHDPKPVSEGEARMSIFTTVKVLNELFS